MIRTRSRSVVSPGDDELRLPRPPGVIRRFWARHPRLADVLIALLCLLISLTPARFAGDTLPDPLAVMISVVVPLCTVAACVALLFRRRHPFLAFSVAVVTEISFLFLGGPGGTPMLTVSVYTLAVYISTRAAWAGLGVAVGSIAIVSVPLLMTGVITLQAAANGVIGNLVIGLIGALIGINVGGRKRYLAALIDRSRQLLVERDQQARLAAAAERARIAREMHDIVSHSLTVIVALSEGAAATADPARARTASTAAADTARTALSEMRSMLGVLRDDDAPLPLAPATAPTPHETVTAAQRAGFPVTLTSTGDAPLDPALAHAVSRIVQEGVTNAMRHAPTATTIAVRVERSEAEIEIEIVNDAASGPTGTSGYGLQGLAERVAHIGGVLEHGRIDGSRWRLRAALPVADGEDEG